MRQRWFRKILRRRVFVILLLVICRFVNDELQSQIELEQENAKREDG